MPDKLKLDPQADDQRLLAQVVDYYHQTLKETPDALEYLGEHGISSEAIECFRIGYSDRSLGLSLPSKQVKAGHAIRGHLERLGLFRASGHEHFRGSIVFPVTAADATGQIVDLYGHKIGRGLRAGTPIDTFLAGQRRSVWNIDRLRGSQEVILSTTVFDALSFWCGGFRHSTCTFGVDGLTPDHLAAFAEFGVRRVLVTCGELAPALLSSGLEVYRLPLPPCVSVYRYAAPFGDVAQALAVLIRKAEWLGQGEPPKRAAVQQPASPPDITPEVAVEPATMADLQSAALATELQRHSEPVASPVPVLPADIDAELHGDEIIINLGHRRYRVRGLDKNLSFDLLKVNLLVSIEQAVFVDTFDLYSARHRRQFIAQAAEELGVEQATIKKDVGRVLLKLEELRDQRLAQQLEAPPVLPVMSGDEQDEALRLLRDPSLLDRILGDFDVVGETTNKLVGYLAAVSRKLDQPLAVIIQSSSAAGKTSLMEAVLGFVPSEDVIKYSAMTGQSLFYMGQGNLKHKILAIVEEEGAERASYALKLLQSEGELMIASTGKDSSTGRMVTQEYRVEGPVMIFLTTTAIKIDEELLNRCIVLTVDENRDQTRAIHQAQRRRQTLEGLLATNARLQTLTLHRNAQRLLRPLLVANPYAESLTFLDDKTRTRRDHVKYLTLIRAVTLLHQHQRPIKTTEHQEKPVEYIEVTLDDIKVANRLATEVLGRNTDELPPQTRRLLGLISELVTAACERLGLDRADYRFSRRDVREHTGWGHTQLKVHLRRLEELEYLLVHRGGRGQLMQYELLYGPPSDDSQRFLAGLIDVERLHDIYDADRAGVNGNLSGRGRGQVGPKSGRGRGSRNGVTHDWPSTK